MIRFNEFIRENAEKTLSDKASKSGFSLPILRKVYKRGMAAWKVGHRAGASQSAWAKARLYSFLTGGKTSKTADASLYLKAKEALKKKNGKFRLP